jgi:hypothetical protein
MSGVKMNQDRVKRLACEFELVANSYAYDPNVAKLIGALGKIISNAKSGSITSTVDHVPGEYFFQEGDLSKYKDLEASYSRLKLALIAEDDQYDDIKKWAEERINNLIDKE